MNKSDTAETYLGLTMISNMFLLNYNIFEFESWHKLINSIIAVVSLSLFYLFYLKEEDSQ